MFFQIKTKVRITQTSTYAHNWSWEKKSSKNLWVLNVCNWICAINLTCWDDSFIKMTVKKYEFESKSFHMILLFFFQFHVHSYETFFVHFCLFNFKCKHRNKQIQNEWDEERTCEWHHHCVQYIQLLYFIHSSEKFNAERIPCLLNSKKNISIIFETKTIVIEIGFVWYAFTRNELGYKFSVNWECNWWLAQKIKPHKVYHGI